MTVRSVSELGSYAATLVVVEVVVVGSKIKKFYFIYHLILKRKLNHAFLIDTKQNYINFIKQRKEVNILKKFFLFNTTILIQS